MSILSPVASAILSNIQSTLKGDTKADGGSFLSLLESNTGAVDTHDQSLVDTLYKQQDTPEAPAAAAQAPNPHLAERRQPASSQRNEEKQEDSRPALSVAKGKKENPAQPKESAKTSDGDSAPQSPERATGEEKPVAAKSASTENAQVEEATPAQKIRAKIEDLNDLLSSIAAMLGVGVVQVTVTQTTQITLTATQQELQGNQPFIDLSNRFQQLIAAVSASQNLPTGTAENLSQLFGSFQSLVTSFANTPAPAMPGQPELLPDSQALLAQCETCVADLGKALQGLQKEVPVTEASGTHVDAPALTKQLQDMGKWLDGLRTLVSQSAPAANFATTQAPAKPAVTDALTAITQAAAQPPTVEPVVEQAASADLPAAARSIAAPLAQPQAELAKKTDVEKNAELAAIQRVASGASTPAQNITAAPVQANNTVAVNAAVAAAAVESGVAPSANLSSGNNSAGQGGDRPQTGAVASFTGVNTAQSTTSAPIATFNKLLKAQTSAPVAEQVAFNIKTAVKTGNSEIQIQLDPTDLGKLHIKLEVGGDGKATGVVITAEHKSTLELLQRDARGLEAALADAGIKTDAGSLSFNLRGGDQGKDEKRQAFAGYAPLLEEEDALAPLAVVSRSYVVNMTDGLDIKI